MKLLICPVSGTILFSILLLQISGCAEEVQRPAVHPAQGKLLINGEPAEGARVSLHPANGENFDQRGSRPWGKVGADGTFTLRTYAEGDGAPAGDYNVSIIWMANPDSLGPSPDKLGGRLADPKTSNLHVTITEGENQLEPFEIEGVRLASSRPRRATATTDAAASKSRKRVRGDDSVHLLMTHWLTYKALSLLRRQTHFRVSLDSRNSRTMLRHLVIHFVVAVVAIMGAGVALADHEHHHHAGEHHHEGVIFSTASGPWSAAETWSSGRVPGEGAKVVVRSGHEVTYDVQSDAVIRGICVSGTLRFAREKDTLLNVGLIRIETGDEYSEQGFDCLFAPSGAADAQGAVAEGDEAADPHPPTLEIGTANAPIPAAHTSVVQLHYLEGMDKKTCPAIVCCGGRMDLHGAPLEQTWVKLPYQSARVGESRIVLPYPLPGWKEGDRIILTGTTRQFGYLGTRYNVERGEDNTVADNPATEERVITKMRRWGKFDSDLQIVSFDKPLKYEHTAAGDYRAEVANLSRNVVVESADPKGVRGHTMYHYGSSGGISYAEFRHLGKRDTLGKYPIHYHLVGESMRGSSVIGASIWDSHNRWVTIHGTQYLVVRDCVGYKSVGHGYFLEDGTEVYNVLDHNLGVLALDGNPLPEQVLPYDQNLGSGFWWANSLNTFTRNCAVECDEDGFRYEVVDTDEFDTVLPILQPDGETKNVDIRTLPFVRFEGNEAHCQRLFALNLGGFARGRHAESDADVEGVGPDYQHPFMIRDMKLWDSHWGFHCGTPCVVLDGVDFHDCAYGLWRCVMHRHEHRDVTFSAVPTPLFFPRAMGEADYDYSINDYFDLEPIDDLPPATIVTHVTPTGENRVRVRGTTTDNYEVKSVQVNDQPANPLAENFAEWEIEVDLPTSAPLSLTAQAADAEGNVEQTPHTLVWRRTSSATNDSTDRSRAGLTSTSDR